MARAASAPKKEVSMEEALRKSADKLRGSVELAELLMFIRRFWNKPRTSKSTLNNPRSSERSKSWAAQSC